MICLCWTKKIGEKVRSGVWADHKKVWADHKKRRLCHGVFAAQSPQAAIVNAWACGISVFLGVLEVLLVELVLDVAGNELVAGELEGEGRAAAGDGA